MKGFVNKVLGISRFLNVIAGIALTFLMLLTIADIVLRFFRRPIVGTYELVAFPGVGSSGFLSLSLPGRGGTSMLIF
jgi:hypothetical protein